MVERVSRVLPNGGEAVIVTCGVDNTTRNREETASSVATSRETRATSKCDLQAFISLNVTVKSDVANQLQSGVSANQLMVKKSNQTPINESMVLRVSQDMPNGGEAVIVSCGECYENTYPTRVREESASGASTSREKRNQCVCALQAHITENTTVTPAQPLYDCDIEDIGQKLRHSKTLREVNYYHCKPLCFSQINPESGYIPTEVFREKRKRETAHKEYRARSKERAQTRKCERDAICDKTRLTNKERRNLYTRTRESKIEELEQKILTIKAKHYYGEKEKVIVKRIEASYRKEIRLLKTNIIYPESFGEPEYHFEDKNFADHASDYLFGMLGNIVGINQPFQDEDGGHYMGDYWVNGVREGSFIEKMIRLWQQSADLVPPGVMLLIDLLLYLRDMSRASGIYDFIIDTWRFLRNFIPNIDGMPKVMTLAREFFEGLQRNWSEKVINKIFPQDGFFTKGKTAMEFVCKFMDEMLESSLYTTFRCFLMTIVSYKFFSKDIASVLYVMFGKEKPLTAIDAIKALFKGVLYVFKFGEALVAGIPLKNVLMGDSLKETVQSRLESLIYYQDKLYMGAPVEGHMSYNVFLSDLHGIRAELKQYITTVKPSDPQHRVYHRMSLTVEQLLLEKKRKYDSAVRPAPMAFVLWGDPGVGKSTLLVRLAQLYCAIRGEEYNPQRVYHRVIGEEFWPGYNQFLNDIIHYSETGSKLAKRAAAMPSDVLDEITSLCDGQPMCLNMAALEDKGKVFAQPNLLLLDSNNKYMNIPELYMNPAAYFRRFIFIEIGVKSEYRIPGSVALDSAKALTAKHPDDIWMFTVTKSKPLGVRDHTEMHLCTQVNFTTLMNTLAPIIHAHVQGQQKLVDMMDNTFDVTKYIAPWNYHCLPAHLVPKQEEEGGEVKDLTIDDSTAKHTSDYVPDTQASVNPEEGLFEHIKEPLNGYQMFNSMFLRPYELTQQIRYWREKWTAKPTVTEVLESKGLYKAMPIDAYAAGLEYLFEKRSAMIHRAITLLLLTWLVSVANSWLPFDLPTYWIYSLILVFVIFAKEVLFDLRVRSDNFKTKFIDPAITSVSSHLGIPTIISKSWLRHRNIYEAVLAGVAVTAATATVAYTATKLVSSGKKKVTNNFFMVIPEDVKSDEDIVVPESTNTTMETVTVRSNIPDVGREEITVDQIEVMAGCKASYYGIKNKLKTTWTNVIHVYRREPLHKKSAEDMYHFVNKNTVYMEHFDDENTRFQYGFGIQKNYMLVNSHFLRVNSRNPIKTCLHGKFDSHPDSPDRVDDRYNETYVTHLNSKKVGFDMSVVSMTGNFFSDFSKHILDEDLPCGVKYDGWYATGPVIVERRKDPMKFGDYGTIEDYFVIRYPDHAKGMCGRPLVLTYNGGSVIAGLHIGGNGDHAFFSVLNKTQILEGITNLNKSIDMMPLSSDTIVPQTLCLPAPKSAFRFENLKGLWYLGKEPGSVLVNQETNFRRTPFADDMEKTFKDNVGYQFERKLATPYLKPTMVDGNMVRPMNITLCNLGVQKKSLPVDLCKRIAHELSEHLTNELRARGVTTLAPVSMKVAINGESGNDFARRINTSTSAGYGFSGKKTSILPIVYEEDNDPVRMPIPELKEKVNAVCRAYMKEEFSSEVNLMSLKDEIRPLEKVLTGRTRVFYANSTPSLIVSRMFLSPLFHEMVRNGDVFGCALGTNAHRDGDKLVEDLTSFSPCLLDSDFSKFDTSLPFCVRWTVATVIYKVFENFGYNAVSLKMVSGIMSDRIFPLYRAYKDIFRVIGAMGSGLYGTAEENSLACLVIMMLTWYSTPSLKDKKFFLYVRSRNYGDDLLASVKEEVINDFNNFTIHAFCKEYLNMETTSSTKDRPLQKYGSIHDMVFLKRRFVYRKDFKRWVMPLEMESILKSLVFFSPNKTIAVSLQCQSTMDSALRELFFHLSEEQYNIVHGKFLEIFVGHFGYEPVLPSIGMIRSDLEL